MRRVLTILSMLTVLLGSSSALAEKRDLTIMPKVAPGSVPIAGEYRALIVGIDKYRDSQIPSLTTAAKDAAAVRDLLIERYGFKSEHVKTLFNEQATRDAVEGALYALGQEARPDDSVLIYYAGHGQTDTEKERGWWVPFDAKANEPATFIKNASVRDEIAAMKVKHVYLVADSCFSGTLFAQSRSMPAFSDKLFTTLYQKKSRWGLSSGMNEPVADSGKGGHSIFAYFFLKVLRESEDPYLVPTQIYDQLLPLVANNADQTPQSERLKGAGDEGGQFVFRLTTGEAAKPSGGAQAAGSADLEAERQRLQAEREAEERAKFEVERRRLAEERVRKEEEQKKLAEEQRRAEAESKKIEEARVRPPLAPQQIGKEIIGQDGAPMVLVPAGEFLYGFDNQRMSLPAFYMDFYEVTTSRYAAFLQATSHSQPKFWEDVRPASDGDLPVVGVEAVDAKAYCRWAGKRLPTSQEWEKAARGVDGRTYPWGNNVPTPDLANYGPAFCGPFCNVYEEKLKPVNSYKEGRSPYGIYNMAGNAYEWVEEEVVRGGSWLDGPLVIRSANWFRHTASLYTSRLGFRCAQDAR